MDKTMNIMVVDDELIVRESLFHWFKKYGHTVDTASSGFEALEKLEKDGYVEHETEREGKRPERRVYQITEKGKSYFLQLLRDNLGEFTRTYFNDDIGIAFMDQLSTLEIRELLGKKRGMIQSALKQFKEVPEHGGDWHYVISHNIAHLEADLTWIDGIISDLDDVKA